MCFSGTAFGPSDSAFAGIGVRLHEDAGDADGDRGARQHRHELALAARARALAAGQLHRMRRVEHHRRAGLAHDRQRAHVGDEVVVAEARAALAGHEVVLGRPFSRAAARALSITFFMSCGARNWPFLMFTGLPDCATARMKSVWRHRNAGVCSTSTTSATRGDLGLGVHVGQHRHAELALHLGQDLAGPCPCPGRGTTCRASDWPCRSCYLKMNGMPSAEVISFSCPATSICSCSDSTTHGPAIRKNGLSQADVETAQLHAASPVEADRRAAALAVPLVRLRLVLRSAALMKRVEQRVTVPRRAT